MNPFEMVVILVLIGASAGVLKYYISSKNGSESANKTIWDELGFSDSSSSERNVKAHLERLKSLEERIKVLERIATDKGQNLRDEIDNLK